MPIERIDPSRIMGLAGTDLAAYIEVAKAVQAWIAERSKTPNVRAERPTPAEEKQR